MELTGRNKKVEYPNQYRRKFLYQALLGMKFHVWRNNLWKKSRLHLEINAVQENAHTKYIAYIRY